MSYHRYPQKALYADYGRSAFGTILTGTPIVAADLTLVPGLLVGALVMLFLVYGLRTALRHLTVIDVSEIGVRELGPLGHAIPWEELREVQLRYYSTRRDRKSGWMQLKVAGRGRKIGIDSSLEGFDTVVRHVAEAAGRQRLELNEATRENLVGMGIGDRRPA